MPEQVGGYALPTYTCSPAEAGAQLEGLSL
jgi:hypothetical protein